MFKRQTAPRAPEINVRVYDGSGLQTFIMRPVDSNAEIKLGAEIVYKIIEVEETVKQRV